MKLFLGIHFTFWLVWCLVVVYAGSVWSGFSDRYIQMVLPFVLIYSHVQVVGFSIFGFLLVEFLKQHVSILVKGKKIL